MMTTNAIDAQSTYTPRHAKRVLSADVYDLMELSALAFGGIGAGRMRAADGRPHCVIGHAEFQEDFEVEPGWYLRSRLREADIDIDSNDKTLRKAGVVGDRRVSWPKYCELMNIERAA